jgi:hypothetical protein
MWRAVVLVVLLTAQIVIPPAVAQETPGCSKCCGTMHIMGIAHRDCDEANPGACHVTQCSNNRGIPIGCCWSTWETFNDLCAQNVYEGEDDLVHHDCPTIWW